MNAGKFKKSFPQKWTDKWFRTLNPIEKLLYLYLNDVADDGGFVSRDLSMWSFQLRMSADAIEKALIDLSEKVLLSNDGEIVWVKNHIRWQSNGDSEINPRDRYAAGPVARAVRQHRNRFNDPAFLRILAQADSCFSPSKKEPAVPAAKKKASQPAGLSEPRGPWRDFAKIIWPQFIMDTTWEQLGVSEREDVISEIRNASAEVAK